MRVMMTDIYSGNQLISIQECMVGVTHVDK
jgi:hypothetical protein